MKTSLKQARRGFTTTELVVTIVVVGVLVFVLFPLSSGSKVGTARRIRCLSNLKLIGLGLAQYYDDNKIMPSNTLAGLASLSNYLENAAQLFACPSDIAAGRRFTNDFSGLTIAHCSYWYCSSSTWMSVSLKTVMWDRGTCKPNSAWPSTSPHKTDGGNVLWSDGHCSFEHTFPTNLTSSAGVLQFE